MLQNQYIAYSDESYYNSSRYRAISVVSLKKFYCQSLKNYISEILRESNIEKEFKWEKLKSAKYKFVALKFIDLAIEKIKQKQLRIDTLIWDIEDSRHKQKGRDDRANLSRMYYHLYKFIMQKAWPKESYWDLRPDQQSAINWDQLRNILSNANLAESKKIDRELQQTELFELIVDCKFIDSYRKIQSIQEVQSYQEPIVQLADLFAGLSVYSRNCYEKYFEWKNENSRQIPLFKSKKSIKISKNDRPRCEVLYKLKQLCKENRLEVSLDSSKGLRTYKSSNFLNFWLYIPQSPKDRAPRKNAE